jgi:hypothetical protein
MGRYWARSLITMTTEQEPQTTQEPATTTEPELTTEKWLESLDEKSKGFLESHTAGLKSALDNERANGKTLAKQLKDAAASAEKGSELETKLAAILESQTASERKAEFYEMASAKGVTNLKLAWSAAKDDESFQLRDGSIDFTKLQESYPELFRSKTAPTSAGSGAGTQHQPAKSTNQAMNEIIRETARGLRG